MTETEGQWALRTFSHDNDRVLSNRYALFRDHHLNQKTP